jgi:two-component system sensor histidine kinase BaeS
MRIPIFVKLFTSFVLVSLILIVGAVTLSNYSFQKGFQNYLNQTEQQRVQELASLVAEVYSGETQWNTLANDPSLWAEMFRELGETPPDRMRPHRGEPKPERAIEADPPITVGPFGERTFLQDIDGQWVVGHQPPLSADAQFFYTDVIHNQQLVGHLVLLQQDLMSGPLVESFKNQQSKNLFWIIAAAGLVCLVVTLILVKHFLSPLTQLKEGSKALAKGDYNYPIAIKTNDELQDLAENFRSLRVQLKQQKASREQWISDISHELRTPIAVLRAESEAILDGIRKPEMRYIESMHRQIMVLTALVNDLYQLIKSDSGQFDMQFHNFSFSQLMEQSIEQFELRAKQHSVSINTRITPKLFIEGDKTALSQVLMNLFENSLRYSDAPGHIQVELYETVEGIELHWQDSSPGVKSEHRQKIFERLYRVDKSRSREFGGSGLGLSICKSIIELHQGNIRAEQSTLGGLCIIIQLPKGGA